MNLKPYRVAIIGTGMIANSDHIPAWQAVGDSIKLVAVANPGIEKAQATAQKFDIPGVYADPQNMLDEVKPDIVSICTPNVYHKEWTLASIKAGAHVLCEKPVATSYADTVEMFQAAESAGKMLYVAQSMRFKNLFLAARDFIESGELGDIYFAEGNVIRRRGIPTWGKFHMKVHNAGGPLWDLGVHVLDFLFWVMGNPDVKSVSGMIYQKIGNREEQLSTSLEESGARGDIFTSRPYNFHDFDVEDFAGGLIRLKNDSTIMIKVSWAINLPDGSSFSIAGSDGGLQFPPLRLLTNQAGHQTETTLKSNQEPQIPFTGHYRLFKNMLGAIEGKEEMIVKPDEVMNVVRVIESLYRSGQERREITFGD